MKPYIRALILPALIITSVAAYSQPRQTDVIDTPSAFTMERGSYAIKVRAYDQGGMELKSYIAIFDSLYLGGSFDIQHFIGKKTPEPNFPGVVAKVKFTDGWKEFPISVAMGYDSFYVGSEGRRNEDDTDNELNRIIYGPYIAVTKPIYLMGDEQYVGWGLRVPAQPYYDGNDTSYYLSVDFPAGPVFRIKSEIERVYWNFSRPSQWLFNLGFQYIYMERVAVEFDMIFQYDENVNRVLRIGYYDNF